MAILRAEAVSPSSSSASMHKYQVFLSFRGKDTRKNFTDHLYTALVQAKIHTFKDEHELERGKNIGNELQKAIEESEIAIVVFSRNYAESEWCLDELVGILKRNKTTGLLVIPVFYDVQPSHVRSQIGSFGEGFSIHCKSKEKIDEWRAALREVADLGGMVLQNEADGIYRYESKFIQEIVQHIKRNLNQTPVNYSTGPNPNPNPNLNTQYVSRMLTRMVPTLFGYSRGFDYLSRFPLYFTFFFFQIFIRLTASDINVMM